MKDLIELIATFNAGRPASNKWWIAIYVTPFDAEPLGFTNDETKHQLMVSHDPFSTRAQLCIDGEMTNDDAAKDKTFAALLARLEKKYRVKYRLDRASVSGSPPPLKKAVVAWLKTIREDAKPANTFEAIAASKGANEKAIARWLRALESGKSYALELDKLMKLTEDDAFVATARAYLDGVTEIPAVPTKAYNRVARVMCLLARGDARSHAIAKRFLARAKKSDDAKFYVSDFDAATK